MKKLTEGDIIKMIREEYRKKIQEFDVSGFSGSELGDNALSKGLKIRHKKTNLLYTVYGIGVHDIVLKTPEGKKFIVTKDDIEKDYKLD